MHGCINWPAYIPWQQLSSPTSSQRPTESELTLSLTTEIQVPSSAVFERANIRILGSRDLEIRFDGSAVWVSIHADLCIWVQDSARPVFSSILIKLTWHWIVSDWGWDPKMFELFRVAAAETHQKNSVELSFGSRATCTRKCQTVAALPQTRIGQETRTPAGVDLRGACQSAGLFDEG